MIFSDAGPRQLAVLRIVVYSIWFALIFSMDTSLYAALPSDLNQPFGIGALLGVEQAASQPVLLGSLKVGALAGCVLAVVGIRPFWLVGGAASLLILFFDALTKSYGSYVNHAQIVPVLLAVLLPFFPAADGLSLRPLRKPRETWLYRAPLLASAMVLVLTYCFIGVRRLFLGGVGIYTDDSMLRWVVARTLEYGAHDVSVGLRLLELDWLVPLLAGALLATTVFEILSPLALRARVFRWFWITVIALFHVSTLLLMDIFFWENLILLAVLFTPLSDLLTRHLGVGGGTGGGPLSGYPGVGLFETP